MIISSYCSLLFLGVFLPISAVLYSAVPKKARPYILLLASYTLFALMSGVLIAYLIVTTLSVYGAGIWLSDIQKRQKAQLKLCAADRKKALKAEFLKKQRMAVALALAVNIGLLALLKYTGFFAGNVNDILALLNIPLTLDIPKFAAPIGISFYTLQAASYVLDVYRGKISADRNLGRLALFISFFPQIMEGPICRYSDTAERLWLGERIHFHDLTFGLQRILFGVMKKIVIADRLNLFVENAFSDYAKYNGTIAALAAVLYTCQLYMEFSGTMDIVIGCGEIFGIRITENFRRPFFSKSISEFWQRWHITLGTWFKDYIFYPMSMSKPLKRLTSNMRKRLGNYYGPMIAGSIALFCVWLSNGLWHGAGWQYIFFGMYHFFLILCGNMIIPLANKTNEKLHIDTGKAPYKVMQIFRTAVFVCIGELFFRANGLKAGLSMFGMIVADFSLETLTDGTVYKLGMDPLDFMITALAVAIILVISILNERGISVREWLSRRSIAVRWLAIYAFIMFIVIFGAYGAGYAPVAPIYADF